jgi:hypothetical protein
MVNPAILSALEKGDLENALVAATPGGIEAQEKSGQTALVNSTNMPREMRPNQEAFEKVGFRFGDAVDELFVSATLPPGWTRAATDHAMHSDILDDRGRKRVGVFYKAAFYDRRADASLECRYTVRMLYGKYGDPRLAENEVVCAVQDAGVTIFQTRAVNADDWDAQDAIRKEATAWRTETYPDASDPTAYWD